MSEILTEAPSATETVQRAGDFDASRSEVEDPRLAELDRVLTPLVSANADVIVKCPWMGDAEVTLSDAMRAYPSPMIEEDPYTLAAIVSELLANRPAEKDETEEVEIPESKSRDEPAGYNKTEAVAPPAKPEAAKPISETKAEPAKPMAEVVRSAEEPTDIKVYEGIAEEKPVPNEKVEPTVPAKPDAVAEVPARPPVIKTAKSSVGELAEIPVEPAASPPIEAIVSPKVVASARPVNRIEIKNQQAMDAAGSRIEPENPKPLVETLDIPELSEAETEIAGPEAAGDENPISPQATPELFTEGLVAGDLESLSLGYESGAEAGPIAELETAIEPMTDTGAEEPNLEKNDSEQVIAEDVERTEQASLAAEDAERALTRISEIIETSEPETAGTAGDIIAEITETATKLSDAEPETAPEAEIQAEIEELFTKLYDCLGIEQTPDEIECLSRFLVSSNRTGEVEASDEEETDEVLSDSGTHEIIRDRLVNSNTIHKAKAYASAIGKSALLLYNNVFLVDHYLTAKA